MLQRIHSSATIFRYCASTSIAFRLRPTQSRFYTVMSQAAPSQASAASASTNDPINLLPMASPAASALFPFPGFSSESAQNVRQLLDENHKTFHCFFNDSHFHNHLAHHLLASLSIGSPPSFFQSIWNKHTASELDPQFHLNKKPVNPPIIDDSNWFKNLDNASRYWPLLSFFDQEIHKNGIGKTLEKFVFSQVGEENDMSDRLLGGAVHPLIHVGYGAEFRIGGVVAEGLAMACSTKPALSRLFPKGWHDKVGPESSAASTWNSGKRSSSIIQNISKRISSLGSSGFEDQGSPLAATPQRTSSSITASNPRAGLSVFTLTTLMSLDPTLSPGIAVKASSENKMSDVSSGQTAVKIEDYCQRWITTDDDLSDPNPNLEEALEDPSNPSLGYWTKLEELIWFNTLLLGATSRPGKDPKHDFFLMHCNNSLLFLPTLLPVLSKRSRSILLHAHLRTCLFYWIARGRPTFHIDEVLMRSTDIPLPGVKISQDFSEMNGKLYGGDSESSKTSIGSFEKSNPWHGLMENLQHHVDEHLVKAVRALSYWNTRLSSTEAGVLHLQEEALKALSEKVVESSKESPEGQGDGKDVVGLNDFSLYKGLENLDGSAFIRTSGQLMITQGWKGDGENHWNFEGPGFEETWE